jgi:hypothetical protein
LPTPRPVVSGNVPATCTQAPLVILITNQAVSGRLRVLPRSFTGVQTFRVGSLAATLARPVVSKAAGCSPPDPPPPDPGMPPPALPLDDDSVKGFGASRSPQYRSSWARNYGRGSLLQSPSPGRSGQSFLLVIYLPAQPVRYFPLVLQSEASAVICSIVMIRASSPIHKSQMMPPEA